MTPLHDFDEIVERRGTDSVKWKACADGLLPMWVADTDFRAPAPLVRALEGRVGHGVFGYSDWRDPQFNEAVAHWLESRFAWRPEAEWVAFSPSVVTSLALCITAFTRPGDSVLFLSPSYPPFYRMPEQHGRKALPSPLVHDGKGWTIDFADLEEKMARPESRLFLLCNPHNPTGRVFSRRELLALGELCLKHGLFVVSDEIHCDFVFPEGRHLVFPSLSPELAANSLVTLNPSKTFNVADLHASAVICPDAERLAAFVRAAEGMALHGNALGRLALVSAYRDCAWYADQVCAYVRANLEHAVGFINSRVPGIRAAMPEATFLLWLDCRELGLEQEALDGFFRQKAGLALSNGLDFGPEGRGFMRMNLGCPRAVLEEALARLERAVLS